MKKNIFILCFTAILFTVNFLHAQTITITPLANNTLCACQTLNINYTTNGVFNIGNVYTVQLSNDLGNFAAATNIGVLNGNAPSGTISCVIPCNTPYGTGYRIRIVASSPLYTSPDNGINLTINPSPQVTITQTGANCIDTLIANATLPAIGPAPGLKYYIEDSPPWGSLNNVNEMNAVFGAGNWIQGNYFSPAPATIFTPATQFVFLEGGDFNMGFPSYLAANLSLIEGWVNQGGRLFLNAAPNYGVSQIWGFGGTILNYQDLVPPIANAVPGANITNMLHPINIGPYTPLSPGGIYTANYFAHGTIINGGTTLIHSSVDPSKAVLTEKPWGAGLVLFGGMTTTDWHNNVAPLVNSEAVNLRKNILYYTAGTGVANPNFGYLWAPGGEIIQKIVPNATGIYTVTVTTNAGCTGTATYNYIQVAPPPTPNITASGTLCKVGDPITLDAGPGYNTYLWDNGLQTQTRVINTPGTYWCTVSNGQGCTAVDTIIINLNPVLNLAIVATPPINCNGDSTTIFGLANGGTPAYQYGINGGALQPGNNFPNTPVGNYTVIVQDAVGCTQTSVLNLIAPPPINITINPQVAPCNGLDTITVLASGGVSPYQYQLNGGPLQPSNQFVSVAPGTYTVTVQDANGCTKSSIVIINVATPINVSVVDIHNAHCYGLCNGTAQANSSGGASPYSYAISAPGVININTGAISNLCAGTYTVTSTDANTCFGTTSFTITEPPILTVNIQNAIAVTCNGPCDGGGQAIANGGTPPYTYGMLPLGNINPTTGMISNLCAGTYTITVTDANNCFVSTFFFVDPPSIINLNITNSTPPNCNPGCNGTASVSTTGGIPPYNYSIAPAGALIDPLGNASNLCAGIVYTISVIDSKGCTRETTIQLSNPNNPAVIIDSTTNPSCMPGCDGTAITTTLGGTAPFTYSILPAGPSIDLLGNVIGLCSNISYTITVTDINGCSSQSPPILVNSQTDLTFTHVNIHEVYCYGEATGSIAVVANGGSGNIAFSISPAATQLPLGFFKYLSVGTYTITATDANGCTNSTTAIINQNPRLRITDLSIVEPVCAYDSTGVIQTSATGGVAPLMYSLNNGIPNLTGIFTGLVKQQYKLTLIDNLGCSLDTTIEITGPSLVGANIKIEDTKCIDSQDGRVFVAGNGGRGGYKYFITPSLNINKTGMFFDLAAGIYTLRVVDTVGCEYQTTITINPPSNPLGSSISKQDLNCHGRGNEGSATVNAYGGQIPYVYEWNTAPVQNTATAKELFFGWYYVQVTDANGCEIHDSVYIEEGPCCDVTMIPNAFSPNGDNVNDEFRILTTAGIEMIQLDIYDRWGQRVWYSIDWKRGWDGRIDGRDADMGNYYYLFRYRCTKDGKVYNKKGDVMLIR